MPSAESGQADTPSTPAHRLRAVRIGGACLVIVLGLIWFNPLFRGMSFSTVAGHQNAVYPWHATPNQFKDYPQSDQADLNFPWQSELTQSLDHGTIPWWNANSFGGQPLYANGSSSLLYPPRVIAALTLSPTAAHDALSAFHVILAGLFTYLLLLDLDVGPVGAVFGATAWMLGSFTLAWTQLEVVTPIFTYLPLCLLTMRRALLMSRRWVVAAAASIAVLLVAAHILLGGIAVAAVGVYGFCLLLSKLRPDWRSRRWRGVGLRATRLAGSGLLGIGLAGFVLVPTAVVIGYVSRSSFTYNELTRSFLLAPSKLRYAFGPPPLPVTVDVMHEAAFVGTLPAVLALIGLTLRRRGAGLGRGLVVLSALIAIGGPLTWLAFHLVPGMNVFRPWSRLLFLFTFGVAVLGAIGLDRLISLTRRPGERHGEGLHARRPGTRRAHRLAWPVANVVGLVIVAITAFQLGTYGRKLNPPFPPSQAAYEYPLTPLLTALGPQGRTPSGWPDRLLPVRSDTTDPPMLYSAEPLVFGIDSAGGYDSSVPTRTVNLWRVVAGEQPGAVIGSKLSGAYQPAFSAAPTRYELLPRSGVDRIALTPTAARDSRLPLATLEAGGWQSIYSGPDGTVLAWTGQPTGPSIVHKALEANTDAEALSEFTSPSFDYLHTVVLQRPSDVGTAVPTPAAGQADQVRSATRSVNGAHLVVRSSAPGWLVIPDMWDPGWSASVNGHRSAVLRANYAQQAVRIPAGDVTVSLHYRPAGLITGIAVSAASLIGCLLLVGPNLKRRRRPFLVDQGPSDPVGLPGNDRDRVAHQEVPPTPAGSMRS